MNHRHGREERHGRYRDINIKVATEKMCFMKSGLFESKHLAVYCLHFQSKKLNINEIDQWKATVTTSIYSEACSWHNMLAIWLPCIYQVSYPVFFCLFFLPLEIIDRLINIHGNKLLKCIFHSDCSAPLNKSCKLATRSTEVKGPETSQCCMFCIHGRSRQQQ